jgi:hypothetical protein
MSQTKRYRLHFLLLYILALLPFSLVTAGNVPSSQLTVDLGYSTYQGFSVADLVSNKTNTNFLGIRYAAAPTATLRFAAPHPPAHTAGVQIAGAQPNRCLGAFFGMQSVSPFRNSTAGAETGPETRWSGSLAFEARAENATIPPFDEDCLFLKYVIPFLLLLSSLIK